MNNKIIDRNLIPLPEAEINFKPPLVERLSDDSKFLFNYNDKLPIIHLNLLYSAGNIFDPQEKKGLANLMAILIDEGAGNYNSLELNEEINKLGSSISVVCSQDFISFTLVSLKEHFERTIELLGLIINKPKFEQEDFLREKSKLLARLLQLKDDAEEVAERVFEKVIFRSNPYGNYVQGNESTLKCISLEDVRDYYSNRFYNSFYGGSCVGDIYKVELENLLEKNNIPIKSSIEMTKDYECEQQEKVTYIVNMKDAVQSEIRIGYATNKREESKHFKKKVMNAILGGQFTSRINLNLREKNGYTYGARTLFNYNKNCGFFLASASVNSENTGKAIQEIFTEFKNIREDVNLEEVQFAKSSLIRKFTLLFETYMQIASSLNTLVVYELTLDYYNSLIEKLNRVTLEEVIEAAKESILPDKMQIVIVGNKQKVVDTLSDFDYGKIIELNDEGEVLN